MNSLPLFFQENLDRPEDLVVASEETRRHVVTVLRMQVGESILLTDGKGLEVEAEITKADKKTLELKKRKSTRHDPPVQQIILAISLLKNATRFEWMLEKATEIGITAFYPLLAERTERQHFRGERLRQILISASMQSGRFHFPVLHEPISLTSLVDIDFSGNKYIAHCMQGEKQVLRRQEGNQTLLIGPEGDFSPTELDMALAKGFQPVTLGNTRLRTETAGMVGAVLMCT
ncbi:MAG: 16S rRNA (uracil(1498)-N(3))-methyltransferase [Chitinophagia bacterium]|jgi:16S rRNA (uracil1498-N3)-methyltransferase|nr:16S rRNA (uracil(1498)-N(3))-methyltransferase [Chitinophagia bacterium]